MPLGERRAVLGLRVHEGEPVPTHEGQVGYAELGTGLGIGSS